MYFRSRLSEASLRYGKDPYLQGANVADNSSKREPVAKAGVLVSSKDIQSLLTSEVLRNLDLVFLAACHSELIGHVFIQSGVKHVVCIRKENEVLDDAACAFTKFFYNGLMNSKTVCDAFVEAKRFVKFKFKQKESDMFILLKENIHDCFPVSKCDDGVLQCTSDHV